MMCRRLISALALALIWGASAGCAHAPPAVRPGPAPATAELLRVLASHQAGLRSMNARARATSWIGGDRLRATVLMLVERSGRLRFEAEISLQGTVSILTTDGGRFQLLDMRNNQLQQGPACPANVASLIRIPLAPTEVAAILLGDVLLPPDASLDTATVTWDAGRGADVLTVKNGAGETRVFFHPRERGKIDGKTGETTEEIVGASVIGPAGPIWRTQYEDLQDAPGGLRMPSLIRFAERASSYDDGVEIRFKDRTPGAEMAPDSFTITPPAGTKVVQVGCPDGGDPHGGDNDGGGGSAAPRP